MKQIHNKQNNGEGQLAAANKRIRCARKTEI